MQSEFSRPVIGPVPCDGGPPELSRFWTVSRYQKNIIFYNHMQSSNTQYGVYGVLSVVDSAPALSAPL